jgi:hypothetical protein
MNQASTPNVTTIIKAQIIVRKMAKPPYPESFLEIRALVLRETAAASVPAGSRRPWRATT